MRPSWRRARTVLKEKHDEIQSTGADKTAAAREDRAETHCVPEQTSAHDDARRRATIAASANRQAAVWRLFGGGKLNALEGGT